ncbi:MAG: hypothetical protein J0G94_10935 [Sphingomonadales bacterium]|nr:hypothetical protein [Sphingomonadales bacterium]
MAVLFLSETGLVGKLSLAVAKAVRRKRFTAKWWKIAPGCVAMKAQLALLP